MRRNLFLLVLPLVALAACQTLDEELDEYRFTCAKIGHRVGTPDHTKCVEGLYRDAQNQEALRDAAAPRIPTCREVDAKGRKVRICQ